MFPWCSWRSIAWLTAWAQLGRFGRTALFALVLDRGDIGPTLLRHAANSAWASVLRNVLQWTPRQGRDLGTGDLQYLVSTLQHERAQAFNNNLGTL